MIDHGTVKSTVQPNSLILDESSVWVNSDIQEVTETIGEETFVGYQYTMKQYGKDEYIQLLAEQNGELEDELVNTQLALCEVYELIGG